MKKKKQIFLHIGLYKTGSTYLQKNIFQNIDESNFYVSLKNFNPAICNESYVPYSNPSKKKKKFDINRVDEIRDSEKFINELGIKKKKLSGISIKNMMNNAGNIRLALLSKNFNNS